GNWTYTPPETLPVSEPVTDGFTYTATDGDGDQSSATQSIFVQVGGNAEPVLTNNGAATLTCGTEVIDANELSASDADNTPAQIEYRILTMSNGVVFLAGVALAMDDTFTQADLDAGLVYLQHDGNPADVSAGFTFTFSDGTFTSTEQTFAISVAANGTETEGDVIGNVNTGLPIVIGSTAVGSLTIAGATLNNSELSASAVVGDQANSFGYVCVTGPNADWQVGDIEFSGGLVVGNAGTGEMRIENGADVTITSDDFDNLIIGGAAGGNGTVIVSGAGSTLTTVGTDNTIRLATAANSTGLLVVQEGAVVSTLDLDIGRFGTGQVDIIGTGSKIIVSNDNGSFSSPFEFEAGFVGLGTGEFGNTTVEGGDGILNVLQGGTLEIRDGIQNPDALEPGMVVARAMGSTGIVTVDGEGSSILISQTAPADPLNDHFGPFLQIGRAGQATMTIANGGLVSLTGDSSFVQVGRGNAEEFEPGPAPVLPQSMLNIQSGGDLLVNGLTGSSCMNIGQESNGNGRVEVTGSGSTISIAGTQAELTVGNRGNGELAITDGGAVTVAGGNTTDDFAFMGIGNAAGGTGSVVVSGFGDFEDASTLTVSGTDATIRVGGAGAGDLTVADGGVVNTLFLEVGRAGTGVATINGGFVHASNEFGSFTDDTGEILLDDGGFVRVGRNAGSNGTLSVINGGLLLIDGTSMADDMSLQIAREVGSTGTVLVSGAGSTISIVQDPLVNPDEEAGEAGPFMQVGRAGQGNLTISNDGLVELIGQESFFTVSRGNADEFANPQDVPILDQSVLTIASGGDLVINSQGSFTTLEIGVLANGDGLATVTGEGSSISISGAFVNLTVGDQGLGQMVVELGADVTVNSTGGADLLIGSAAGSSGTMVVSNLGSTVTVDGLDTSLVVGFEGEGFLLVEDKAVTSTTATEGFSAMTLGAAEGGIGIVGVIGEESVLAINGTGIATYVNLTIAEAGFGEMSIAQGADVTVSGTGNGDIQVGNLAGSTGYLTVTGVGSTLIGSAQDLEAGMSLLVGVFGFGEMQVADSAQVVISSPGFTDFTIGYDTDGVGEVFVTTGGSILINGGEDGAVATVGAAGTGSLEVSAGGQVTIGTSTSGVTFVGANGGGVGNVLVDGEGSALKAGEDLVIGTVSEFGTAGAGTVMVTNGGTISAGTAGNFEADIWVGLGGTLGGNGTIIGDVNVVGGTILPGVSPGTLNINGDLVVNSGFMVFEFGGTTAGSFDVIAVTGQVVVVAPLVTFDFTYAPMAADSIAFITAANGINESLENAAVMVTGLDLTTGFDWEVVSVLTGEVSNSYVLTVLNGAAQGNGIWFEANTSSWTFTGGAGADVLIGNLGNDMLYGDAGNDTIDGGDGNDSLDGGANIDTAVFNGSLADYIILDGGGILTVEAMYGGEGIDTLTGFERLQFADTTYLVGGGPLFTAT
ncbi:MAG: beta strand repeat-containing protein, partial [Dongiaceae bacterium]